LYTIYDPNALYRYLNYDPNALYTIYDPNALYRYLNYGLVVGTHRASPLDEHSLRHLEMSAPSRFGGRTPIEDTYHVMIAGPLKKGAPAAAAAYGTALREMLYEIWLEFEHNIQYDTYRKHQLANFQRIVDYDKVLRKHKPNMQAANRLAFLEAFRLADYDTARNGLVSLPPLNPKRPCLSPPPKY
jgi:hypothetical protein